MTTTDENNPESGFKKQNFVPQSSYKALGIVALAIIVGFVLVMIVNSNDSSDTTASPTETTAPVTTQAQANEEEAAPTTTAEPVENAKVPSEVEVLVLNGSTATGIAGQVSEALGQVGYGTLTAGDESAETSGATVYFKNGFEEDAQQIATNVLPGILRTLNITQDIEVAQFPLSAPTTWDQDNLIAANVVIVIGNA